MTEGYQTVLTAGDRDRRDLFVGAGNRLGTAEQKERLLPGILKGDDADGFVADSSGHKVRLRRGASDAALAPYHVDRSKLFALDRLAQIEGLDAHRIAQAIEFTRFPGSAATDAKASDEEGSLLRAADFIGQLGDPHYLRKTNALFCELQEVGLNNELGYASPTDLVDQYSEFYWNNVSPRIQTAIRYLDVTSSGRQWIANLYSNVFRAERDRDLAGLQHKTL